MMDYADYRLRVVAEIVLRTGWTVEQALNITGDVAEMMDDDLSPEESAHEILLVAQEDG